MQIHMTRRSASALENGYFRIERVAFDILFIMLVTRKGTGNLVLESSV